MYKFTSPLRIQVWKKTIALNLNWFRNCHHIVANNTKIEYKRLMREQLEWITIQTPISVSYYVRFGDRRAKDVWNFISVIEKFFLDALVEYGCIPDYNCEHVISSKYYYCGIDKWNEGIDIHIESLSEWFLYSL